MIKNNSKFRKGDIVKFDPNMQKILQLYNNYQIIKIDEHKFCTMKEVDIPFHESWLELVEKSDTIRSLKIDLSGKL